jgi:hypothetical protein
MTNKVLMKYLGKKTELNLTAKYLKNTYFVEGPGAEVLFTQEDATAIIAESPKMFQLIAIMPVPDEGGAAGKQMDILNMVLSVKGRDGSEAFRGTIQELCDTLLRLKERLDPPVIMTDTGLPTAEDMLRDDAVEECLVAGTDFKRNDSLDGDGLEGEETVVDDLEATGPKFIPVKKGYEKVASDSFTPCERLVMPEIMRLKVPELREYMQKRFNVEYDETAKRYDMLREINELEGEGKEEIPDPIEPIGDTEASPEV